MKKVLLWKGKKIRELSNRELLYAYEDCCRMQLYSLTDLKEVIDNLFVIRDEIQKRMK